MAWPEFGWRGVEGGPPPRRESREGVLRPSDEEVIDEVVFRLTGSVNPTPESAYQSYRNRCGFAFLVGFLIGLCGSDYASLFYL